MLGIIDTGQQWDHPALKSHYRGWNGATADHNYNWYDATNPSSQPSRLTRTGTARTRPAP